MSFSIVTFGCRVNQADSLALEAELRHHGASIGSSESADVVIVNTCSVTAAADQSARQSIRRLARLNPVARVVVTGCYATRCPDELASLPNVVRVLPNTDKERLVALLTEATPGQTTAERYGDGDGACGAVAIPGTGGRTTMTLRVQTGCDEQCSYCIIPKTRGRSRSHPMARVLSDIDRAVTAGYKEIVLTGVHLGSYGRDLAEPAALVELVRVLAGYREDVLFRISSLEPMDCAPQLLEFVASSPRLAPHFHLPLQHGSDDVLAAMRRPYTTGYYTRLLESIRARLPFASIGTDLIVGFPGETEAQFDEMFRIVHDLPLTHLHVFPYSDRPGTEASSFGANLDGAIIRARGRALRDLGEEMSRRFRRANLGVTSRALTIDDGRAAVTPNYLKVKLDRQCARNEWVDLQIESADPLAGRVVRE